MRKPFNLDQAKLESLAVLVYGPYGAGKTHLLGDFLRWAKDQGSVKFINMSGEDGFLTLSGMGLGDVAETVESMSDFEDAMSDAAKAKLVALGVDTLPAYEKLVMKELVGEYRYPDPKKDGERAKMLWGQIKIRTEGGVIRSRHVAKYVMWTATYDRTEDPFGGGSKFLSPNLIGKTAVASAGWFDLVAILTAEAIGPGRVKRILSAAPRGDALTRQRFRTSITKDVEIPEGGGGWKALYAAIEAAMGGTA